MLRAFELLKKVVHELDDASLSDGAKLLLEELDSELTSEDYEEGDKVDAAVDKLETELAAYMEREEDETDVVDEEEDEEDDDEDEFEGLTDEEEDEEEVT